MAATDLTPETMFWQAALWKSLCQRVQDERFPHALLLSGVSGLGKRLFARHLAGVLLCDTPENENSLIKVCGQCHSCQLLHAQNHPDFLTIEPQNTSKTVTVDQVRNISQFLAYKSHSASRQVVLLEPAESMNRFAANSLLKTLEEPSGNSVLLLVSDKSSLLLPTVRSRCQTLVFNPPSSLDLIHWLEKRCSWDSEKSQSAVFLADGSPLTALEYGEGDELHTAQSVLNDFVAVVLMRSDPLVVAKNWQTMNLFQIFQWLIAWTGTMIRLKSGLVPPDNTPVILQQLQKLAQGVHLKALYAGLDKLLDCYKLLNSQVNPQLMLEDFLIEWRNATK